MGVCAIRAAGNAAAQWVVLQPGAGALGIGRAAVAFVADRIHERAGAVAQPDGIGRPVLDEVGVRPVVQVAVGDGRGIGTDDEMVAGRQAHAGQGDGVIYGGTAAVAIDQLEDESAEVDGAAAGVLELDELGRIRAGLVVVDFVDHQSWRDRLRRRRLGECKDTTQRDGQGRNAPLVEHGHVDSPGRYRDMATFGIAIPGRLDPHRSPACDRFLSGGHYCAGTISRATGLDDDGDAAEAGRETRAYSRHARDDITQQMQAFTAAASLMRSGAYCEVIRPDTTLPR